MTTPEKVPSLGVDRIVRDRDTLAGMLAPFVGRVPEGETFAGIAGIVSGYARVLPDHPGVLETVRSLPTGAIEARPLWRFAWRVAANKHRLRMGRAVRPWTGQAEDEWVAFEILSTRFFRSDRYGPGRMATLRAMSGSFCGETLEKFWLAGSLGQI